MAWAKLCGTYAFHRKILEVGNEGAGAHARMISYAAESLSGGKISRSAALIIASQPVIDRLLAVVLLERDGDDFVIHDFGDHNPTGEELAERRTQLKAKRAEAGRRGAAARWYGKDGKLDGKGHGNGDGKIMPTSPSPSPSPCPSPSETEIAPPAPLLPTLVKPKREPKHTPQEIAAKGAVVDAFVEGVKAKKGITPKLTHAGDHAAAFQLGKLYGPDEGAAIVTKALEDPFVAGSNCTIRYIASKADTWRGNAPRPRNAPIKQEATGAEPWLQEHIDAPR